MTRTGCTNYWSDSQRKGWNATMKNLTKKSTWNSTHPLEKPQILKKLKFLSKNVKCFFQKGLDFIFSWESLLMWWWPSFRGKAKRDWEGRYARQKKKGLLRLGRTIEFLEHCWRKRRNAKRETEQTNAKMKQILQNFADFSTFPIDIKKGE